MATLSKPNYKWVIILTFIGIILVPSMMPSPTFKTVAVLGLGAISLFFEFLSLKNINSATKNFKAESRQTWVLILMTIILLVFNFVV